MSERLKELPRCWTDCRMPLQLPNLLHSLIHHQGQMKSTFDMTCISRVRRWCPSMIGIHANASIFAFFRVTRGERFRDSDSALCHRSIMLLSPCTSEGTPPGGHHGCLPEPLSRSLQRMRTSWRSQPQAMTDVPLALLCTLPLLSPPRYSFP